MKKNNKRYERASTLADTYDMWKGPSKEETYDENDDLISQIKDVMRHLHEKEIYLLGIMEQSFLVRPLEKDKKLFEEKKGELTTLKDEFLEALIERTPIIQKPSMSRILTSDLE